MNYENLGKERNAKFQEFLSILFFKNSRAGYHLLCFLDAVDTFKRIMSGHLGGAVS